MNTKLLQDLIAQGYSDEEIKMKLKAIEDQYDEADTANPVTPQDAVDRLVKAIDYVSDNAGGGGNVNVIKPTEQVEKIIFPDATMTESGNSRIFKFDLTAEARAPYTLDVVAQDNGGANLDYSQQMEFKLDTITPGTEATGTTSGNHNYKVNLSTDLKTLTIEYDFQFDTLYATKNLSMEILSDRISPDDVYNSELVDNKLLELKKEAVLGDERLLSETSTGSVAATGAPISNQGAFSVAIGFNSGGSIQGASSVAVGYTAGQIQQGQYSVAIGSESSTDNQPKNSIAIGYKSDPKEEGEIYIGSPNVPTNILEVKGGKLYIGGTEVGAGGGTTVDLTPYRTSSAQDTIDAKTLADAKAYTDANAGGSGGSSETWKDITADYKTRVWTIDDIGKTARVTYKDGTTERIGAGLIGASSHGLPQIDIFFGGVIGENSYSESAGVYAYLSSNPDNVGRYNAYNNGSFGDHPTEHTVEKFEIKE